MSEVILAIDTATEQCSVALYTPTQLHERVIPTARGHAEMILPLIDEVLRAAGLELGDLSGLAFGRGPGSFTGVRVAVSVIQGLALATRLPVVGISDLAAVAQQAVEARALAPGARVLVAMDARMQEVYWAVYELQPSGYVSQVGEEHVTPPQAVEALHSEFITGTAMRAYPFLKEKWPRLQVIDAVLPRAGTIAWLAVPELRAGRGVRAEDAQPVYVRDHIAWTN